MAKRSREIMVVKALDVQYGRPGAIVRLQRTLGTQPRPQGLLYAVVSPPKIGCSHTGPFPQISLWGNNLGYIAISYPRERQNLNSGNAIVKASQEQKTLECRGPLCTQLSK